MTGSFAQLHVALNNRLEHQRLKMSSHLLVNLVCQTQTAVVHRQEEALYLQFRIQLRFDNLDCVQQLADTLQREILTLHRDDDRVGSREMTESAAVSELTVISPSEGEQSIKI